MQTLNLARRLLTVLFVLALAPVFASPTNEGHELDADAHTKVLIERRLSQDDLDRFHRVEVSVVEGVVTLRGSVRTSQTRDALLREVMKITGVREVHPELKVQPTP